MLNEMLNETYEAYDHVIKGIEQAHKDLDNLPLDDELIESDLAVLGELIKAKKQLEEVIMKIDRISISRTIKMLEAM